MQTIHCRRAVTCLLAAMLAGCAAAAEPTFDPALAKAPPPVQSASIELLAEPSDAGNAVLRLHFADKRSKSTLTIQGGPGPTLLRDDGIAPDTRAGDGEYAALVNVNAEQFGIEQRRRIALAQEVRTLPVFEMRELLGFEPFEPSSSTALKVGRPTLLDKFKGVPIGVDAERELLIRNLLVVGDPARTYDPCTGVGLPMGAWTFGTLMTEIANEPATGVHPSDLVEHWINQWKSDQIINSFTVTQRAIGAQRLLDQWPRLKDGRLSLAQAPLRLLAIVNRQDLRGSQLYGNGDGNGGEARFVFGVLSCPPLPVHGLTGEALEFMVILEYGIQKSSCLEVRDWARQWRALGDLPLGSAAYNAALQAITDQFTLRNARPDRPPNRSAINQVRTNEFSLNDIPQPFMWELRESRLRGKGPAAGRLEHVTLAQTPSDVFRNSSTFVVRDYVNDHEADILAAAHVVPLQYPAGSALRGGATQPGAGIPWNPAGVVNPQARHLFSLATCHACHTGETGTDFTHISRRQTGFESQLSGFLTGITVNDPVTGLPRTFNELLHRRMQLDLSANLSCRKTADFAIEELFFRPMPPAFVH